MTALAAAATLLLAVAGTGAASAPEEKAPPPRAERPRTWTDVPSWTSESVALSKALKKEGFRFVGPTTAYAAMQACGLVDDHLATCPVVTGRSA